MRNKTFIGAILVTLSILATALGATDEERERFRRGNEAYSRGHYQMAIIEYREALVLVGDHFTQAQYNIGICYYELGRKSDAVVWFRAAIKSRNGNYPRASYALGITLKELNRLREAKAAFSQAVKASNGEMIEAVFMLGVLLYHEGDYKQS